MLDCSILLEEYVTDKGRLLMFNDERSRCLGEIKIGYYRAFVASSTWGVDYTWAPKTFGNFQTVVRTRTETDGVGIADTSCSLLRAGRAIEQVKFKETTTLKNFYAFIKYGIGVTTF